MRRNLARIEECLKLITYGFTNPMPDAKEGPWKVTAKDIKDGRIDYDSARHTTSEAYENDLTDKSKPIKGDILLTKDGTLGRLAIVDSDNICINQSVALLRVNTEVIIPEYLYYILSSPEYQSKMLADAGGSTIKHIYITRVDKLEIPLLELKEQYRFVQIVKQYDDLIENNNRQIRLLEEAAQRLYKEWFVYFRFPGNANVNMHNGIPAGWKVDNVGNLFKTVLGGTPSREKSEYWGGNIPWINSGEVNKLRITKESEFITDSGLKNSSTKLMPKHTTVLAITGATLGQVSYTEIETCANQSVVGVYDESEEYSEYIYLCIFNEIKKIISKANGGAQQHINKVVVNKFKILLPDSDTNSKFKDIVSPMFDKITTLYFEIERLTEARNRLLPKLVNGEIKP